MFNVTDMDIFRVNTMSFDNAEMPVFLIASESNSFRLTASDLAEMPDDTKDPEGLRRRLTELLHEKFNGNYLMFFNSRFGVTTEHGSFTIKGNSIRLQAYNDKYPSYIEIQGKRLKSDGHYYRKQ